jgi:hypothetical protein
MFLLDYSEFFTFVILPCCQVCIDLCQVCVGILGEVMLNLLLE